MIWMTDKTLLMTKTFLCLNFQPLTWTELGSWLRVLMKETSTPKPPEGLEGYMEDVNEYHDIIDDTRDLETDTITDMQVSYCNMSLVMRKSVLCHIRTTKMQINLKRMSGRLHIAWERLQYPNNYWVYKVRPKG